MKHTISVVSKVVLLVVLVALFIATLQAPAHAATRLASASSTVSPGVKLSPADDTCGSVFIEGVWNDSFGDVTLILSINGANPYVTFSTTYITWYSNITSGSFYGSFSNDTGTLLFNAAPSPITLYGSTTWSLSDRTSCSASWTASA